MLLILPGQTWGKKTLLKRFTHERLHDGADAARQLRCLLNFSLIITLVYGSQSLWYLICRSDNKKQKRIIVWIKDYRLNCKQTKYIKILSHLNLNLHCRNNTFCYNGIVKSFPHYMNVWILVSLNLRFSLLLYPYT